MHTQTIDTHELDIAISTVARYAGMAVVDVLSTLGWDIGRHPAHRFVTTNAFRRRHHQALLTVAKYSGIDIETVAQRLEHPEPVSQDQFRPDKAA